MRSFLYFTCRPARAVHSFLSATLACLRLRTTQTARSKGRCVGRRVVRAGRFCDLHARAAPTPLPTPSLRSSTDPYLLSSLSRRSTEGTYDALPESAFYMVGGLEDVKAKAAAMAKEQL